MRELEEYYSTQDAFKMIDIITAKSVNEALASEASQNRNQKGIIPKRAWEGYTRPASQVLSHVQYSFNIRENLPTGTRLIAALDARSRRDALDFEVIIPAQVVQYDRAENIARAQPLYHLG
ncbi:hypothetical protein WP1_034 [Pseudomonas phage WP1]